MQKGLEKYIKSNIVNSLYIKFMYTIFSRKSKVRTYYEIESGEIAPKGEKNILSNASEERIKVTQVRSYAVLQGQILVPSDYDTITDQELYSLVKTLTNEEDTLTTVRIYEFEKLLTYLRDL